MSNDIIRYDMEAEWGNGRMCEMPGGDWVKAEDFDALLAKYNAITAGQEPVGRVFTMEAVLAGGQVKCHAMLTAELPAGTLLYTAPQPPAPARVVMPERRVNPYGLTLRNDDVAYNEALDDVARLNAQQPAEQSPWVSDKPTKPGAYWIRGNGLDEPAVIQVKIEEGELWCNLHQCNTEPHFGFGYTIDQLSDEFEWFGPLAAPAEEQKP